MKRTREDKKFSDLIRIANNFICQRCGFIDNDGQMAFKTKNIHLSHFIGRSNYQVRWHPWNGYCMCASCHHYLENRPYEHSEIVVNILGVERCQELHQISNENNKWYQAEKNDLCDFMDSQLEDIKNQRMQGVIQPIDVELFQRWKK